MGNEDKKRMLLGLTICLMILVFVLHWTMKVRDVA